MTQPVHVAPFDIETASFINNLEDYYAIGLGHWTSYVPVWTTSGTGPALNNGTLTGFYLVQGHTIEVRIKFTAGSTTSFGTGAWFFTLPPFARSTNDFLDGAITGLTNGGSSNRYLVTSQDSGTAAFSLMAAGFPSSGVSGTVPFTWASGHYLTLHGCYEAA
jgi:hypothetical protein